MRTVNVVGSLRNLIEILAYMPLDRDWQDWRNLELAMIEKRRSMGINARKDIFAELVVDPDTNRPREPQEMIGDIDLLVIAGSGPSPFPAPFLPPLLFPIYLTAVPNRYNFLRLYHPHF